MGGSIWGSLGFGCGGFATTGIGMGSTLTLGLVTRFALSFEPAGLPFPLFGSGSGSGGWASTGVSWATSVFSGIVASASAIFLIIQIFF